jgi:two-component system response regulator AtoC
MTHPVWHERKHKIMKSPHVLVMSEDFANAHAVSGFLAKRLCNPEIVYSEAEALLRVRHTPPPDLVLLELHGGRYSLRTLRNLVTLRPGMKVVVVSAHNDTRQIVEAIRMGAHDYLTIPVGDQELERLIQRHTRESASKVLTLVRKPLEDLGDGHSLVAASAAMRRICVQAEQLAHIEAPVLLTGENFTGKAAVARLIHLFSSRSRERFMEVNCAALPGKSLEKELFGCNQGVAGIPVSEPGKIELCNKGTVLVKDILETPATLQSKLLPLLQGRQLLRLGEDNTIEADVRVLATTNANFDEALAKGRVCKDVYYQLSAFVIQVPPLRQRSDDIPALLHNSMARLAVQNSRLPVPFSRTAMDVCMRYSWPGNLRELEHFVQRYLVQGEEAVADIELGSESNRWHASTNSWALQKGALASRNTRQVVSNETPSRNLKSLVRDIKNEAEVRAIKQALQDTKWNRKHAARLLNISYRGLLYKIRQHSLTREPRWDHLTPVRDWTGRHLDIRRNDEKQ